LTENFRKYTLQNFDYKHLKIICRLVKCVVVNSSVKWTAAKVLLRQQDLPLKIKHFIEWNVSE